MKDFSIQLMFHNENSFSWFTITMKQYSNKLSSGEKVTMEGLYSKNKLSSGEKVTMEGLYSKRKKL